MTQNFEFSTSPAVIDFLQNMEVMVMAPNHGMGTLGSILGPMGSHRVQKMGQNRKNLPCHKIWIFDNPGHQFFAKNGIYGYAAKSWWGHPRVHLGANGVLLGQKNGWTLENYCAPKFEFSTTPWSSIFPKKWNLQLWRPITVGTPRGHLGPMGSLWV